MVPILNGNGLSRNLIKKIDSSEFDVPILSNVILGPMFLSKCGCSP